MILLIAIIHYLNQLPQCDQNQLIAKLDFVYAISDNLETSKFQKGADPWTQNILASYTPQKTQSSSKKR